MRTGFQMWLRQQVTRLESEIRASDVFETDAVPTHEQLMELRRLAAVHRYMERQLAGLPQARTDRPLDPRRLQENDVRQSASV